MWTLQFSQKWWSVSHFPSRNGQRENKNRQPKSVQETLCLTANSEFNQSITWKSKLRISEGVTFDSSYSYQRSHCACWKKNWWKLQPRAGAQGNCRCSAKLLLHLHRMTLAKLSDVHGLIPCLFWLVKKAGTFQASPSNWVAAGVLPLLKPGRFTENCGLPICGSSSLWPRYPFQYPRSLVLLQHDSLSLSGLFCITLTSSLLSPRSDDLTLIGDPPAHHVNSTFSFILVFLLSMTTEEVLVY